MITFPLPIAMIVAPMAEFFYKITKTKPRITRYSIETIVSNSAISSDKAKQELGYTPRSMLQTVTDTVQWWMENLGLTHRSLRF